MAEPNSGNLESFQTLHENLVALSERRFTNLEKLGAELDEHAQYFHNLLDKKVRNPQSRSALGTGKGPLPVLDHPV
jgi:hypothetical protein